MRISGGGRGMRHIRAHLAYITRNGKLPAFNQNDDRFQGWDDLAELGQELQVGGFLIAESSERPEAFNIILSMPAGTPAEGVRRAAMRFAADEFEGHQYVLVLHSFETDPHKDPARHPHVHLCVKARRGRRQAEPAQAGPATLARTICRTPARAWGRCGRQQPAGTAATPARRKTGRALHAGQRSTIPFDRHRTGDGGARSAGADSGTPDAGALSRDCPYPGKFYRPVGPAIGHGPRAGSGTTTRCRAQAAGRPRAVVDGSRTNEKDHCDDG